MVVRISIHAPRTGSDLAKLCKLRQCAYFNPRSPHGERQQSIDYFTALLEISIHAPRTGSDAFGTDFIALYSISIHAPRTGSDKT